MNPTKEELDAIESWLSMYPMAKGQTDAISTILTRYRDGELVEKDRPLTKDEKKETDCKCADSTGWTTVKCCNQCGKSIELFWRVIEEKWIIVNQDAPFDGSYLCFIEQPQDCGNILKYQRVIQNQNNMWVGLFDGEKITHFQPLPTPPTNQTEP